MGTVAQLRTDRQAQLGASSFKSLPPFCCFWVDCWIAMEPFATQCPSAMLMYGDLDKLWIRRLTKH